MKKKYFFFFFINSSAPHHFNSEAFLEGRGLITEGVVSIKANIRNQNYQASREMLGRVLHTLQVRGTQDSESNIQHYHFFLNIKSLSLCLCVNICQQDFYSHSNWVELGNTEPFPNLIHPDLPIENIAGTCVCVCM